MRRDKKQTQIAGTNIFYDENSMSILKKKQLISKSKWYHMKLKLK